MICPSRRIVSLVSCALLLGSASSFHSPATFHKPASSSWGQNSLITISSPASPASGGIAPAQNEPNFGRRLDSNSGSSTKLMFMGSDGGFLGVGGPELALIVLVGYFVLGPSDLYKLTKEIGKFIQNIQTLGTDLSTTLETNMESQLQLEDLRKAQRELTDAFSFRRSINVDDSDAFATNVATPRTGKSIGEVPEVGEIASEVAAAGAATATAAAGAGDGVSKKKKKMRRRKIVKEEPMEEESSGEIPDLDMSAAFPDLPADPVTSEASSSYGSGMTAEEEAVIEQDFAKYTMTDPNPLTDPNPMSEWYENTMASTAKLDSDNAAETPASMEESRAEAQTRFQQQLSGTWNDQVLANQDKLSPLASVMELLAVLEQEKIDADKGMEEEFRSRAELKEVYYKKQRRVLEEAVTRIQQEANVPVGADQSKD